MKKTSRKILLNAEPFGFGPAAAIATFFPYLRNDYETLAYMGTRHTLDLQRSLAYDAVYDSADYEPTELDLIIKKYDVFITALDFEMAARAQSLGLQVIIYDPLTWFWKDIHPVITGCDMYIAQNFIGVTDRIKNERNKFSKNTIVVPPIVSVQEPAKNKDVVLLNMGGLQNPHWKLDDVEDYARQNIKTVQALLGSLDKVVIATSSAVAERLSEFNVKSYARDEMEELLKRTKLAFMTPGLGNIYDTASYDIPTVWLPPANESQKEQLELMKQKGLVSASISDENSLEGNLPTICGTKTLLDEFGSDGGVAVYKAIKSL
ncbi:MAG: hypothetical protein WCG20_01990 [bacterium]